MGGEAEWSQTYVVGSGLCGGEHIGDGVCRGSDYFRFPEYSASFRYRHVVFPEMHAIGTQNFHKVGAVVDNEHGTERAA